jgi:hypothetical protein
LLAAGPTARRLERLGRPARELGYMGRWAERG